MTRYLIPLVFGLGGFAVLVGLGTWPLQRLEWKEAILSDIAARIGADPVAVPRAPDPKTDRYLPVRAEGDLVGTPIRVLVSTKESGAGYRIITPFALPDGRRIMVDEGFVDLEDETQPGPARGVTVTGNLHWPDEVDGWTPDPDVDEGLFYARDVDALAQALDALPVLVIAREVSGPGASRAMPLPVTTEGIPNNHLGYAVQWYGLAVVWLGMTAFLLWRIRQRTV